MSHTGAVGAGSGIFLNLGIDFTEVHFIIIYYDLHYVLCTFSMCVQFSNFKMHKYLRGKYTHLHSHPLTYSHSGNVNYRYNHIPRQIWMHKDVHLQ